MPTRMHNCKRGVVFFFFFVITFYVGSNFVCSGRRAMISCCTYYNKTLLLLFDWYQKKKNLQGAEIYKYIQRSKTRFMYASTNICHIFLHHNNFVAATDFSFIFQKRIEHFTVHSITARHLQYYLYQPLNLNNSLIDINSKHFSSRPN